MRSLLAGEEVEDTPTLISASLLIRHTCGCGTHADRFRTTPNGAALKADSYEELALIDDALRETIRKQLAAKRVQRELGSVAGRLLGVRDYRELARVLTEVMRLFDVRRFALCTYAAEPRLARVILESSGRDVIFCPQAEPHAVTQLLQSQLSRRDRLTSVFIEPLELADEQLGFLVIEGDLSFALVQLELRSLIAAALSRLGMLGEIRRIYSEQRKARPPTLQAVRPALPAARESSPATPRQSQESNAPRR
jgi:hypothetical protein